MKTVFIVGGGGEYAELFKSLAITPVTDMSEADLVCFTGGADVSPELYGDAAHQCTCSAPSRDVFEKEVFIMAQRLGLQCVGICRGAQFLNCMSGGRMYQHVEGHTSDHGITDLQTGEVVYVSSTHHQMMMPSKNGYLVASSAIGGRREWFDGQVARSDVSDRDIEVVYYTHTNSLCFQPHPEFLSPEYEGMRLYFGRLVNRYLNGEIDT